MIDFGTVATAMITPFDKNDNVDFAKTTQLVNYLIENGTTALVVAGTTGESPTLTTEEKVALFRHVVQVAAGRVPVVAGTGNNNTQASIELTKKAEEAGVDAVMLVAPYYNKPNQEGLYQHFKTIAESTELPVMLYNIPGRSVVTMSPDTIARLAQLPNVVALKDAGGDVLAMTEVIEKTDDSFMVYSGDDGLTLPAMAIGAKGVISVASHVIGNELQEMIAAFQAGDFGKAQKLHQLVLRITKALFMAPNPTPVKTALQMRGLDVGSVRLPLVPLTEEERQRLYAVLQTISH
ncbi:4-hydroxy-tetrahydrodipicolinate synthase [Ectobacillus ponti]|uniref:4-hydroxy-tetrahydrodipicolinate synthase n=1 Tax=Ectobacillus ponti TaxID=2961894 RepID=A0AA41X8X6_9BACI|nr:4-hydroxy-tetrahydrodipicolinate synthase [Ectobacillus ponti]MCP8969050.1 4-hydroxy-tetrahydrodipicolinate synthase [Ectobacillus ponti]